METRLMWTASAMVALTCVGCSDLDVTYAAQGLIECDDMTCSNSVDLPAQGLLDCRQMECLSLSFDAWPPPSDGASQILDLHGFHELSLSGAENQQGIAIETMNGHARIHKANQTYDLEVLHGRLVGTAGVGVIQAEDLIGAEIRVGQFRKSPIVASGPGRRELWFSMHIDSVRRFSMPFAPSEAEVYRITVYGRGALVGVTPLCAPNGPGDFAGIEASRGMEPGEVVMFEGDRFDVEHKTMSRQLDLNWFNLGCAGSALAKLYLMNETAITQSDPLDGASWRERQAMFKMLVGDYCGNGFAFTVPGEPLLWQGGRVSYALSPLSLEARWDADGATCLGTPRLDVYPAPTSGFSPEIMADIGARCGERTPPSCTNTDPHDRDGAIIVSGNRP